MVSDSFAVLEVLAGCDYEPIGDYGLIGDCRSAALVSRTGSIDWLCLPHFSSPSVFGALLDRRRGGRFLIRPREVGRIERRYLGSSAVLETVFQCAAGRARLVDFMPLPLDGEAAPRLMRLIECEAGEIVVDVAYQPCPDYGRQAPKMARDGDSGWIFRQEDSGVLLHSDLELEATDQGDLLAGVARLAAGQRHGFAMLLEHARPDSPAGWCEALMAATRRWWETWCSRSTYQGAYREMVMRSCLTLKLLAHRATGAVIAAPTTSLPEALGAGRNWDYRYCWLRDTSLLLQSFVDLGYAEEAGAFLGWLLRIGRKPRLQPLYDLHGRPVPDEFVLAHWEGYRGCGPVRIGNSAHQQLQLDIFGEVIQTAYRFVARGGRLNAGEKRLLVSLADSVCRLWRQPDQSIWETRSPPRHYTYSKLMCWAALDRILALNRQVPLDIEEKDLLQEREEIRRAIEAHGYDAGIGSYVGYFGGREPDASLLLMLRYAYAEAGDPRLSGTHRYIMERLARDGFLYRYPPGPAYDGVEGRDNLFAVCSYWAVDYLARSGETDAAMRLFERLLAFANDLGLYGEQFDSESRLALGNFPQAFSHSGLVTAALAIEQCRQGRRGQQIAA